MPASRNSRTAGFWSAIPSASLTKQGDNQKGTARDQPQPFRHVAAGTVGWKLACRRHHLVHDRCGNAVQSNGDDGCVRECGGGVDLARKCGDRACHGGRTVWARASGGYVHRNRAIAQVCEGRACPPVLNRIGTAALGHPSRAAARPHRYGNSSGWKLSRAASSLMQ